jgi:signal transduction histidine kinase
VNARDAMPAGGRLLIETRNVTVDGEPRALAPGRYALLSVSDNGHGMDAETARRAFEPFFTTKEPGKGMGLGTFLVRTLAEQLGGRLRYESAPDSGTSAILELPVAVSPVAVSKEAR